MPGFTYHRLRVYTRSVEFMDVLRRIIDSLPRGSSHFADQLRRAGSSIPLNIAEGAAEYSRAEKARFYRIAKRSATECAAILDVLVGLRLMEENRRDEAQVLLNEIVGMLTRLIVKMEGAGD